MSTIIFEEYEWDERKNEINKQKHNVSFAAATRVFIDHHLLFEAKHQEEKRWLAIGFVEDKEIAVVYTMRSKRKRIISARIARDYEREALQGFLEELDDGS